MKDHSTPTRMASSPRNKVSSKRHIVTGIGEELGRKWEPSQSAGGNISGTATLEKFGISSKGEIPSYQITQQVHP